MIHFPVMHNLTVLFCGTLELFILKFTILVIHLVLFSSRTHLEDNLLRCFISSW